MNPKTTLLEVAERAIWHNMMFGPHHKPCKPGEFLENHVTDEEREALRELKSNEAQSPLRLMLELGNEKDSCSNLR